MTLEDAQNRIIVQNLEMQVLIEDLKTDNEELRASLVALSTANEELATKNVELQVERLGPDLMRRYNLLTTFMIFNHPDELTYIKRLVDRPQNP